MTLVTSTPLQGERRSSAPDRSRTAGAGQGLALGLMTAPAVFWYALFMIGPAVAMVVISTLHWPGLLAKSSFAGIENYQRMAADPSFRAALRNTAIHVGVVLTVMIPTSFMLAYYLNTKPRGHRILRVLCFTPALLSISARAMVFFGMFAPGGLLNGFLKSIGLSDWAMPWLANAGTALGVVIAIDLWSGIGFTAVLFAARMTSISGEVLEAAELDGAGQWRKMWSIAYPMVKDYVGMVTMLQFLWTLFYSATTVLLLTKGGPGNSSTTLSFMVYQQAFIKSEIGYSQAIGVCLFIVGLAGMMIIRRSLRQDH
jgi:multiple sugar transport system permease protein